MGQQRGQSEWTLVYLAGGRALAQIDLAGIDVRRLRADIFPRLVSTMGERPSPWSLMLVDEVFDPEMVPVWSDGSRRDRFLLAINDWLDVAGMGTQGGLRRLHAHTLRDLRSCLVGREVHGETTIDGIAEALANRTMEE